MFKNFEQFNLNESKHGHFLDDLKTNFRSWEQDHDNQKDAEELFNIMSQRHPEVDPMSLKEWCYRWVGYEEPKEKIHPKIAFHEAFQKYIFGQKVKKQGRWSKENQDVPYEERFDGEGIEFENGYKYISYGGGCSGEDCNTTYIVSPDDHLVASENW